MKNGILALMGMLCLLLIVYVMGGFDYGSFLEKDAYGSFARDRQKHVEQAPEWNVGVISIAGDAIAEDMLKGVVFASNMINARGGIAGKPVNLVIKEVQSDSSVEHKMLTQELCDRKEIAAIVGGVNTVDIPSHRCLTQFQAMPLISPVAVFSSDLPSLSPDTSMTFYPDITHWTEKLAQKLMADGYGKVVIISPIEQSYGGIFGVEVSKAIHAAGFAESVYTINYSGAAERLVLYRSLKVMSENRDVDAIVFTSTPQDLNELTDVLDLLKIKVPIYATDYMDIEGLDQILKNSGILLNYPVVKNPAVAEEEFIQRWIQQYGSQPSIWAQLGAQSVLTFKEALDRDGGLYDPALLIRRMKEILSEQRKSGDYSLDIEVVTKR